MRYQHRRLRIGNQTNGEIMSLKLCFMAVAFVIFAIFSCADHITESRDAGNGPGQSGKKAPASVQAIFDQSCALSGCHRDFQRPFLTADVAYDNIVGAPSTQSPSLNFIEPGDPSRSYLYLKITGGSGIIGTRMPQANPPLPAAQIDTIRVWIENGAPSE